MLMDGEVGEKFVLCCPTEEFQKNRLSYVFGPTNTSYLSIQVGIGNIVGM